MIKPRPGIQLTLHSERVVYVDAVLLESELAPLDRSSYQPTDMPLLLRRGHVGFVHTSWLDCGPIHFHRVDEPENLVESDARVLLSVLLWSQPIQREYGFSELLVVLYWDWASKQRLEVALQEELGSLDWEHLAVDRHAFLLNEHRVPNAPIAHDDNL